jgi:hypothetical protein
MDSKSHQNKYLLLLESPAQYNAYLENKQSFELHELLICCLSISAIHYCEELNLTYFLPENCFTKEDTYNYQQLSEIKIKELVHSLNEFYHKQYGDHNGFKFDMGNYHFFMLYHFFGAIHYRAFILFNIFEKCKMDRIIVTEEKKTSKRIRPFPISQYPNCYLELCRNSKYKEKLIVIPISTTVENKYQTPITFIRGILSSFFRKSSFINDFLNFTRSNINISKWKFIFNRNRTDVLLLGAPGPWKYILSNPVFHNNVSVIYEGEEELIYNDEVIRNWFDEWFSWEDIFLGFNVGKLAFYEMARIKIISEKILANHEFYLNRLCHYKCVIFAVAPHPFEEYILSVAKFLGIPRICFQHGEMSLYYPGLWNEASELLYASHYFSYGENVSIEKTASAKKINNDIKSVSIGSPALDILRNESSKAKFDILYASSKFLNYSAGFVARYADLNIYKAQEQLLSYFEAYLKINPDKVVVWKQNQERLTGQPIYKVDKVKTIREEITFTQLLRDAQMVILDRPSTTSLEACMTNKPLFVLISGRNWLTLPEKLLKKRAIISYTPEELLKSVDLYLNKGIYNADVNNREFVVAYGSHIDDGKAIFRSVSEFHKIISNTKYGNYLKHKQNETD